MSEGQTKRVSLQVVIGSAEAKRGAGEVKQATEQIAKSADATAKQVSELERRVSMLAAATKKASAPSANDAARAAEKVTRAAMMTGQQVGDLQRRVMMLAATAKSSAAPSGAAMAHAAGQMAVGAQAAGHHVSSLDASMAALATTARVHAAPGAAMVGAAAAQMAGKAKSAGQDVADLSNKVGFLATAAQRAAAPLVGLVSGVAASFGLRQVGRTLAGFEVTIAELGAVSGASAEDLERLEARARELGATTSFSAQQAAEALVLLAKAGYTTEQQIAGVADVLQLAIAGQLGLAETADIAVNISSQFGLAVSDLTRMVDALVVTANASVTDVRDLAEAMKYVGPVSGALGISLEQTNAALGALGDQGIKASQAGTNLRGILLNLISPSAEGARTLERMGIALGDVNPAANDLAEVFRELQQAGLDAAEAEELFGKINVGAALILTNSADKIADYTQRQLEGAGAAKNLADTLANSLRGATLSLLSALEELTLQAGDRGLLGAMRGTIDLSTEVVQSLSGVEREGAELSVTSRVLATQLRALTYAFVALGSYKLVSTLAAVVFQVGAVTKAVRVLNVAIAKNPIGLLAAAAAFAVVEFTALGSAIAGTGDDVDDLTSRVDKLGEAIAAMEGLSGVVNRALDLGDQDKIAQAFDQVIGKLEAEAARMAADGADAMEAALDLDKMLPERLREQFGAPLRALADQAAADAQDRERLMDEFVTKRIADLGAARLKILADIAKMPAGYSRELQVLEMRLRMVDEDIEDRMDEARKEFASGSPFFGVGLTNTSAVRAAIEEVVGMISKARETALAKANEKRILDEADANLASLGLPTEEMLDRMAKHFADTITSMTADLDALGKPAAQVERTQAALQALADTEYLPPLDRAKAVANVLILFDRIAAKKREIAALDVIAGLEQRLELDRLRFAGNDQEAEALELINSLHRDGITLTAEEEARVRSLIAARAEATAEAEAAAEAKRKAVEAEEARKRAATTVDDLFRELELEASLIGKTTDERERAVKMRQLEEAATAAQAQNISDLLNKYEQELIKLQKLREMEQLGRDIGDSVGGALEDIVFQSKSASDAVRELYGELAKLFFRQFVTKQISGYFGSLFTGAESDGATHAHAERMARGSILDGPTSLPLQYGRRALAGEAGPEAVIPLARDSQGRLGIRQAGGGGGELRPVYINFEVKADTPGAFREAERQIVPRLQRMQRMLQEG